MAERRDPSTRGRAPRALIAHPGAELYGSDRVMLETITGLVDAGWHVDVTIPERGPLLDAAEQRGASVRLDAVPVLRKAALRPWAFLALVGRMLRAVPSSIRLLRSTRPDVVYVSTLTIPLWLLLARLLGVRLICHVHESEGSVSPALRRALALPTLLADRILVNSEYSRSALIRSFAKLALRSTVVDNPVVRPDRTRAARPAIEGPVRVLYMGRLAPRKGPHVAVEMIAELRRRGIEAALDIIGSPFTGYDWYASDLRDLVARLGLEEAVRFHGFQPEIAHFVERSDLVVVPSQGDEPFGNTAVEAILAARPVVVSAGSGLEEAVQGYSSAQRVPHDDPSAWADALERVIADWPEFRADALTDARVAAERHAPSRYHRTVADIMASLAGRSSQAASPDPNSPPATPDSAPVTIAMLTFRRPDDLAIAVPSLIDQIDSVHSERRVTVLVVDNDPAASASEFIEALDHPLVRYAHEPMPGIAAARNRALREADPSGLLIFIDDDERPEPGWLASLLSTHREHTAAAVVGPVLSEFDGELDPWISSGGFFTRRRMPTGTSIETAATNNLLLDLRRVAPLGLSFDERFGVSGGSDTLFTRQLTAAGESMIWCDEAIVVDRVPSSRATRDWVLRRAFRSGNSWTRTSVELESTTPRRLGARLECAGAGVARVAGGALRFGAGTVTSTPALQAHGARNVARGAGMIASAFGYVYLEYKTPAAVPSTP